MTLLSLNLNKAALIRNSRSNEGPELLRIAETARAIGVKSITVHPREDRRHITPDDVIMLSQWKPILNGELELNIEGNLRAELRALVAGVRPTQYTVVPATRDERTSSRGWGARDDQELLRSTVRSLDGVRVSVFVEADLAAVERVADAGARSVELFTGPYAEAGSPIAARTRLTQLRDAAALARTMGLRVNAGHGLNLQNLPLVLAEVRPDEVSIGHAVFVEAIYAGIGPTVREYITLCQPSANGNVT